MLHSSLERDQVMSSDDRRDASARSNRLRDELLLGRRDYLQYTGAAAGFGLASQGVAAESRDGNDESDRNAATPTNLRVEYEHSPNNLNPDGDAPRFFWELTSGRRGATQTAYRVLVADSTSALQNANGNVWDSGRVESDQSVGIEYGGPSLDPDTTYYWGVRIWDGTGTASDWNRSMFMTAIPSASEHWEGEWIGAELDQIDLSDGFRDDVSLNPLLRKEFDIDKEVTEARLHISGLGYNEPYLNGECVGDNVLDPALTDYESTVLFTTYDVTDLLKDGRNAIGVALSRGRYGEPAKDNGGWNWSGAPWWSEPELLVQMNIEFADSTSTSIVTNETWQATDAPTRYDSLFCGELYDAREEQPGWTKSSFEATGWNSATVVEGPDGDLKPQRLPPVQTQQESPAFSTGVSGTIEPVSRSNPEEGVYVFDMGVNFAGWTRITVEGSKGTEVSLRMGEKLNDDGTVFHDTGLIIPPAQEDRYVLNGEGTETWEASFSYKGFRYVEIEGFPGTPTAEDIEGVVVHSDIASGNTSNFTCSNDLLNQIHEQTCRALVNNHHGWPTDTPLYEKNGWTADIHATAQTAMYNFDMARFYEKWFRDMRDAQADSGAVSAIVPTTGYSLEPNPGWSELEGPTPAWDATHFIIPWLMYRHKRDERALRQQYGLMKRYMTWFRDQFEGQTPEMGLGDWVSPGENEVSICSTAYYYRELDILETVARVLEYEDDAETYERLKDDIRAAFNREFYNADEGYYGTDEVDTYVQTSNILPLAFGMVPDDRVKTVVDSLVRNIMEEHDGHLYTGLLGTKHILPVLTEHGHHDVAYTVATQTTFPSWGYWVVNGMTSLLESWPLNARSRNHHFLGAVDEWFYRYLAGIREPSKPGFEHIEIAPQPVADLKQAEAITETVCGMVASRWERIESLGTGRTRDEFELAVTIPGNTTATVRIPTLGGEKVRVRESGKSIWNNGNRTRLNHPGIDAIERTDDRIVVEVGSGEYQFELEQLG
jgi:alpha-L-rhamnosidase